MGACGSSQLLKQQAEILQQLVTKHIQDPSLAHLTGSQDFELTSTERGIQRWEHAHLAAALDILNAYQRDRRAQAGCGLELEKEYKDDPRTRFVELLKRWLRANAGSASLREEDVRSIASLCRDVLNHPSLFVSRNRRSFLQVTSEVYDHLRWQLRDVLERDRTCAELSQRVISVGKNLISDLIGYLLLAPTHLRQTDALASLEVVALWQSLPSDGHPLPRRADPTQQRRMREAWSTLCGSLIAALLRAPWCVRLFDGVSADQMIIESTNVMPYQALSSYFEQHNSKDSGLAGAFRGPAGSSTRHLYLSIIRELYDVMYLFGEVIVQFYRVGDGLGDYGMIRVAAWLHPCLDALAQKLQSVRTNLEQLNRDVEETYVLARARGVSIVKPAPSEKMSSRAHGFIERAILGQSSHLKVLLQLLDELKGKSAPERLPHVMEGLGDACKNLEELLRSTDFKACVGGSFPELPSLNETRKRKRRMTRMLTKISTVSGRHHEAFEESIEEESSDETPSADDASRHDAQDEDLLVEVERLAKPVLCGNDLVAKDRRSLRLQGDELHIFKAGSYDEVKHSINMREVEDCRLLTNPQSVAVSVLRPPPGATIEDGVMDHKQYIFKFPSADAAISFQRRLAHPQPMTMRN